MNQLKLCRTRAAIRIQKTVALLEKLVRSPKRKDLVGEIPLGMHTKPDQASTLHIEAQGLKVRTFHMGVLHTTRRVTPTPELVVRYGLTTRRLLWILRRLTTR